MIIVTRLNGADDAGVFTFSFSLACILQVISNFGGRSYQVTEINPNINDSDFIYSKILCVAITIVVSCVYIIINTYNLFKIIIILILLIFRIVESFQDVFYGILQKKEQLYKVGISMLIKAIISTIGFLLIDAYTNNLILSTLWLPISYTAIFVTYDLLNIKKINFSLSKICYKNIKSIIIGSFSVFLFTILTQYVMNASKFAIDGTLYDESQAIFGILIMPATLMVMFGQFIIQPFLTKFKNFIENKDFKNLSKLALKINCSLLLIGISVIIFCYFLGIPILNVIYNLKLDDYLIDLLLILLGSTFFALSYVISNILIALRKNTFQVIIYIIISFFTYFISNMLVNIHNIHGAIYSYLITMIMLFLFYFIYYCFEIWRIKKCVL